jgi:dTDP-4-amino-4,6-dideoxygalactose transaminase
VQDTAIVLPLYHQLTEEDQERVITTLETTIRDL